MKASLSSAQPASPRAQKLNRARLKFLVNNLMMSIALVKRTRRRRWEWEKLDQGRMTCFRTTPDECHLRILLRGAIAHTTTRGENLRQECAGLPVMWRSPWAESTLPRRPCGTLLMLLKPRQGGKA